MSSTRSHPTVLIIDDDDKLAGVLRAEIERMGYHALRAASGREGLEILDQMEIGAILLDIRLGDVDGIDLLKTIKASGATAEVIMLTGHGTVENAISAMKHGAIDFLTKPCKLTELEAILEKACEAHRMREENRGLREYLAATPFSILTRDPEMQRIVASLERVARSDAPVLILGESGTGKELVARQLHRVWQTLGKPAGDSLDGAQGLPFITVNCAALQSQLLESELFGHEKGAFTGAVKRKLGLFEIADGGSIFLDEIGEIDEGIQAKLLRVLQFGELRRVGGNDTLKVHVRIIAATNLDLEKASREGRFRQDLYFRLNVVQIQIPPLRQRLGDIELLARHFLELYGGNRRRIELNDSAVQALQRHSWLGNVRELENVIRRILIFHDHDVVDAAAVHAVLPGLKEARQDEAIRLDEVEKRHIFKVLADHQGDKRAAAEALGIALKTLYNKLHSYGWKAEGI